MGKPIVIIPAYNPPPLFAKLVEGLIKDFSVLVVNDGSEIYCNALFERAAALGAVVLTHKSNKGKGAAIKTALGHLLENGEDWHAVTADADGQFSLADIKRVAELALENPEAMVLGVRNFKKLSLRSRLGNAITRGCFYIATKMHLSDTQTGLRGFSGSLARKMLECHGNGYEYEMNILIELKGWGVSVVETTVYSPDENGRLTSHFHPVRDSLLVFAQVLKHTLASFSCTVLDYAMYLTLLWYAKLPPEWAYLGARFVSASVNFQLSTRLVFRKKPDWRTAAAYYMLALCIVSTGSMLVRIATNYMLVPPSLVKIPIDMILFFANFFIQKHVIFK